MNASLRILVVLPLYGGSLPIGRYCVSALRELGHLAEVFEAPAFHASFTALKDLRVTGERLSQLENSFLQVVSQAVLAKVETFEPDLVLALAQAPMSRQTLKRLKKDGVPTAMWFVEDHRVFTYWQAYAPFYDLFAVIQKEPLLSRLAEIGQPNGFYLPLAAQPDFHRPLELTPAERKTFGADVSFLGAGYPNRRLAFRLLIRPGFKLWGSDWEGDPTLAPYLQRNGARISPEEAVKIFNATAVNLNLHSSVQVKELVPAGDFVNPRTFELAACGAFQLVDRRELLSELFAEDELACFADLDDLARRIDHFLRRPEERQAYASRARARVLAEHAYVHRMRALLEEAARRLPGWPKSRPADAGLTETLPPELQAELTALLDRLGLSPRTPFPDVVWAVKQQAGALSDLETTILFLDEWRKQYGQA